MTAFSKVKLIVSDMDGTLLNSKGEVSAVFFKLFKELKKRNITFCAASGRQHNSIIAKLDKIKDDIFVIAENGGIAKQKNKILLSHYLEKRKVLQLIPILRKTEGANMVLCCDGEAFIESKDKYFIKHFQEYYHSFQQVENLMAVAETTAVFKIAVYHSQSSEKYIYPKLQSIQDTVLLKVSGKNWLDISDKNANKGEALKKVQELLEVSKEETMVFGDYHNDIEMMQEADFSFAMGNAHKDIKALAKFSTETNDNNGVEKVIKELLDTL